MNLNGDKSLLQKIGSYHLGHHYNLEDFLVSDSVEVFPGKEIQNVSKKLFRQILIYFNKNLFINLKFYFNI